MTRNVVFMLFVTVFTALSSTVLPEEPALIAQFRSQEIAKDLTIGYAVALGDLNGDGKLDIVVVDKHRVVWYENPTWKVRTILQGTTKPDNVCLALVDIDGDKQLDIVLGADWAPFNTKSGGTLQWLRRGKSIDDPWTMHAIGDEPTVHRLRVAPLYNDDKPRLILGPLMGRDSSAKNNWMDGRPVRMLAYPTPADPIKGQWKPEVIDETLHVVHNFWPIPRGDNERGHDVLAASYEGVSLIHWTGSKWETQHIGVGNQANQKSNRGASEIKLGRLKNNQPYIATIEPWHGNQVVVYTPPATGQKLWERHVIDEELRWGHAVWCADLDGDGSEELIIGVRDDPNAKGGDKHTLRRGVRIYKATDAVGKSWTRQIIENGGVAVEDLAAGDLDGDGKPDIVAVGRQTGNCRIYWNKTK
jgi:hypothetical protein